MATRPHDPDKYGIDWRVIRNQSSHEVTKSVGLILARIVWYANKTKSNLVNVQDMRKSGLLPGGTEYNTIYKLQHWGFLDPVKNEEGKKAKSGDWILTQKGRDFVQGKITVPYRTWTYDGQTVGYEGDQVSINDAMKNPKWSNTYEDYVGGGE
jgi:hypothetical protein